jgi:hypothetical protein
MVADTDLSGFQVIRLGEILRHEIFGARTPKDFRFHVRALYGDPRGINLRNHLAHGLADPDLLHMGLANWVVHTLRLLGMLNTKY